MYLGTTELESPRPTASGDLRQWPLRHRKAWFCS